MTRQAKRNTNRKPKVFVGMSGGVDSSVSAALLKQAGYDVTGVFIKVWRPPFMDCTWKDDRLDAMRVAAELDIPFITLDLEKEYKRDVVDYMISEYKSGRVPNPDVMCNRFVKFGGFYDFAKKNGADFVVTGHYAQIVRESRDKDQNKEHAITASLRASRDQNKDQTYFLWAIKKEQLPHILFPIGGYEKSEVRKLAEKFGLFTAGKKDSQGLCFMGKVDMRDFLSHFIEPKKGKVLDEKGKVIGEHDGAFAFTIGQRHGFRVTEKTAADEPYYVIAKNIDANTVTVSHKYSNHAGKPVSDIAVRNINWLSEPDKRKLQCRFRYRQPLIDCSIKSKKGSSLTIKLSEPQSNIASGQSLVLYSGEICLGGGIIE